MYLVHLTKIEFHTLNQIELSMFCIGNISSELKEGKYSKIGHHCYFQPLPRTRRYGQSVLFCANVLNIIPRITKYME